MAARWAPGGLCLGWRLRLGRDESGQATVEAAFALPVLLLVMLMLLQPGIVLYDRMVMADAAAEGCRLLATAEGGAQAAEDFVRRRLGSVPPHDLFHVHGGGCTWQVECQGDEGSAEVSVRIATQLKPLPLIDYGARALGLVNGQGNFEVEVEATAPTQPDWVRESSLGMSPAAWVSARDGG